MSFVMNILNDLERIEIQMRDIYAGLSEQFKDNQPYHELFVRLSKEEQDHADHIRYQKRLVRQNPGDFQHVTVDLTGMNEVCDLLDHLLNNPPNGTPTEILRLTIDLESISQERMYRSVIVDSCPALKPLIDNLTRHDLDHLGHLYDFAEAHLPGEFK